MSDRTCRAILVLVITAGAILRLWGLRFGFPHPVARPDKEVIVDTALGVSLTFDGVPAASASGALRSGRRVLRTVRRDRERHAPRSERQHI